MEKDIKQLFKNLCCSKCKADFDEHSIKTYAQEGEYLAVNLRCQNCGRDFGTAFLKLSANNGNTIDEIALQDSRNTPPITADEVLDAHEHIKDFEANWKKFIED
ncbi:hypothetical protein IJV79_02875 [bacterium]|nr:hypothetical protein [bacterium]